MGFENKVGKFVQRLAQSLAVAASSFGPGPELESRLSEFDLGSTNQKRTNMVARDHLAETRISELPGRAAVLSALENYASPLEMKDLLAKELIQLRNPSKGT